MSFTSLAWAARQRLPTAIDKLVLMQIASHVNAKTGLCNPSIATLAAECSVSPRRVITAVQALEGAKLLTVIRTSTDGHKNSNMYKLSTGVVNHVHHVVNDVHEGSANGDNLVVNHVHINIEEEHRKEHRGEEQNATVDNKEKEKAKAKLKEWVESMRLKAPPTPRTPFR